MVLAGKFVEPPHVGFGMDYKGAFTAKQLVGVRLEGNCFNESIVVDSPVSGETIFSPLLVRGRARGTWFFEGDFPLLLKDITGRIIARGFASAKFDWMTSEFVNFEGILEFEKPDSIERAGFMAYGHPPFHYLLICCNWSGAGQFPVIKVQDNSSFK